MTTAEQIKNDLKQELQQVLSASEALLNNAEHQTNQEFQNAKQALENTLKNAKEEFLRIEDMLVQKSKSTIQASDSFVKENPWKTAGIAAGVGVILGLLIARNR
ncbi:MAG: DUF883 domain-containing protein [Undibacterium sp.]|nr:DUF883 domain-containing protein [Undibacterium sp.]